MQRGGINPIEDIKTLYYLWKFFREEKPDIVHLVAIKPYLYGGLISRITGVPALVSAVSGLGTIFVSKKYKHLLVRKLLYYLYRFSFNHFNQKVIFQNKYDFELLVKWGVLDSSKAKLIKGSGVNLKNFTKFEEPRGTPVVCFAARLLKDKGIFDFVSAAKIIIDRGVRARFIIAGELDNKNPTALTFDEFNILKKKDFVEIVGYNNDISTLYADSNIICLPSYREGLPKSLVEAAAASRAVVTTNVPGCRDAIIPNITGLLVPVKNPEKLADALQLLIENPKKRFAMGKAGRKLAEKEFPIQKIVKYHIDIYQSLLDKKNR